MGGCELVSSGPMAGSSERIMKFQISYNAGKFLNA